MALVMADNDLATPDDNPLAAPTGQSRQYAAFGNPYAAGWYQENIVPVTSPSGVRFMVNKAAAPAFKGFLAELEGTGYKLGEGSGGYGRRRAARSHRRRALTAARPPRCRSDGTSQGRHLTAAERTTLTAVQSINSSTRC